MKITMSVAVTFYDSFTGKQISPRLLKIQTEENTQILVKERNFCFLDCKSRELSFHVYSEEYQEFSRKITLPIREDILYIWLLPKKTYPFSKPPTILEGKGFQKYLKLSFILIPKKARMKLKEPAANGCTQIQINKGNHWENAGRKYVLFSKEEKREIIHLTEEIEEDIFLLEKPLKESHNAEEILYSIYDFMTDEKGSFYLPLGEVTEDAEGILVNENKTEEIIKLNAGEINELVR